MTEIVQTSFWLLNLAHFLHVLLMMKISSTVRGIVQYPKLITGTVFMNQICLFVVSCLGYIAVLHTVALQLKVLLLWIIMSTNLCPMPLLDVNAASSITWRVSIRVKYWRLEVQQGWRPSYSFQLWCPHLRLPPSPWFTMYNLYFLIKLIQVEWNINCIIIRLLPIY